LFKYVFDPVMVNIEYNNVS